MASEVPPPIQNMILDPDDTELNLNDDSLLPDGEGMGEGAAALRVRNTKSMPYELRIAIITMKFMCDWNFKQIAKKLDIPRTTASKFWHTTLDRCENPNDFHSLCAAAVALKRGRPKKGEDARKTGPQVRAPPQQAAAPLAGITQAAMFSGPPLDPNLQHMPAPSTPMMGQYPPMPHGLPNGYHPAVLGGMNLYEEKNHTSPFNHATSQALV